MKFLYTATILFLLTLAPPPDNLLKPKVGWAKSTKKYSIRIIKRKVVGNKHLRVNQGDKVILFWRTDEDVDLHLHGYDIEKTILKGKIVTMHITTNATGRFPITSHGFGDEKGHSHGKGALLYLEVHPK